MEPKIEFRSLQLNLFLAICSRIVRLTFGVQPLWRVPEKSFAQ